MKFSAYLISLTALLAAFSAPSFAQDEQHRQMVEKIESCEAILRELTADPVSGIPSSLLQQARGIVVVNQFQGGFLLGGQAGYGIVMVRKDDGGQWSVPCFLDANGASLGLQFGGRSVYTVYLLMDDSGARLLYDTRFRFGADARALIGPRGTEREVSTEVLQAPIIAYTVTKGAYAGATVKTGWLTPDNESNRAFYRSQHTMPELLFGNWTVPPAEARPLISFVQQITTVR